MSEDKRLYLTEAGWHAVFKSDSETLHCHLADVEQGFYHRIATGELYLVKDTEHLCMNCAMKKGILTAERPSLANPRHGHL